MELDKAERAVAFASQPLDEILGLGGTISRLSKQGTKVITGIFSLEDTDFSEGKTKDNVLEMRKKEARTAAGILGVQESVFLGKSADDIADENAMRQKCIKLIRRYRPQIIFSHFQEDKNKKRKLVSEVVEEASSKAGENILPELGKPWSTASLYYYELSELFTHPTDIVDITSTIDSKIKAIKTQTSCVGTIPDVIEYLQSLARVRGYKVGIEYGEAFLLSPVTTSKH